MQRGFLFPLRKGEKYHAYPASTGKKTRLYLPLQGAASSGPVPQLLRQRAPLLRRQQQRAAGVSGGRRAGPGHGGLSVPQAPGFAGGGPDPDAGGPGVRGEPVCLGRATKLCDMLTDKDKVYEAVMLLGVETDTQDTTGQILKSSETDELTEEQVRAAVLDFVGDYNQVPPMYSALKINGKKLYELAREGKTVERAARRVQIFGIEILSIALPRVTMKVHCSKGTYIRTLCHDIGQKLGCGACMEKLTRTKVSRFEIKDSLTLAQIEVLKKEDRLSEILIPIDQMFANYPSIIVSGEAARLAYNGNGIKDRDVRKDENILDEAYVRVYDDVEDFIGVYQYHEKEREYRIRKMFYIKEEK